MKKSKTLCGVSAAALILGTLSGCGGEDYERLLDRASPVTVTVWHYYNGVQQTQFDEMVSRFNNTVGSEKGIYVEAFSKNSVSELSESVLAAVQEEPGAENAPNIFATYVETAYRVDRLEKLAELGKYFTEDEKAEYVGEYLGEGTFGDSLVIFPTAKSTEVMMLNLTDWEGFAQAEGVTYDDLATWESLTETAGKYYEYTDAKTPEIPNDGKAFFGRDAVANYMMIGAKQLGHPFARADADGNVTVSADRDTLRKLWENFYVPYVKGYFTAESRFRSDDAKTGTIIALVCSTTGAAYYPTEVTVNDDYTYPIENVVLKVPNFEGTEPYAVQQGAGMSVIKADEKTEYACAVFLKWFTEEERNIGFSVNSGYLPVKKSANSYEKIVSCEEAEGISDTMLNTFSAAIDEINTCTLYTSPPYEQSAQVRDFIGNTIENAAKADQAAARERILAGEDRESVLSEYTGDAAFERFYAEFNEGLLSLTART